MVCEQYHSACANESKHYLIICKQINSLSAEPYKIENFLVIVLGILDVNFLGFFRILIPNVYKKLFFIIKHSIESQ